MANRYSIESVSKNFQNIMENRIAFGGKTMVYDGDFRQVLPVVKRGSKAEKIAASDGLQHTVNRDFIKLPDSIIIPWEGERSIQILIDSVFPNMINHVNDENFPREEKEYTSWDSVEDDNHNFFPEEFLNSLCPSGLPPHKIILKVGPVMLLRNVTPELGLCNGTRLICRSLGRNFIDAENITGPYKGTRFFLHRMPLKSEDNSGLPLS
ncbi:uncharacterized protein [Primulina eburnea]|uniref:uncharacterized protein n=1 Tax=Primulina eburnea TaxID=1245227 RepID=UPI003C6CBE19